MDGGNLLVTQLPSMTPDGPVLHFLKELPAWFVVGIFLMFFSFLYLYTRDDFIPRIIDALIGALLTAVISNRRQQSNSTNVTVPGDEENKEKKDEV